jgi:UDP-N-acetylglucosamine--N-acetylmuramyl-(pentapeptide) pyrophosphoryl-undecaprenol N-acetylglucosamine transferase
MGGFASGPGGLAAALLRIPLVIHEQNTVPGLTNRWLSKLADRILQAFPNSLPQDKVVTCGNPVRESILAIERSEKPVDEKLQILIVGGSLGARALNDHLPEALSLLTPMEQPKVLHQVGRNDLHEVQARYEQLGVSAEVVEFIDDMAAAYQEADLVVCRAGALTVSEVAAAGIPAIFIPFPHAVDDHQTQNARYLVEAGAARLVKQAALDVEDLAKLLRGLLSDREALTLMGKKALAHAKPNATACVAEQVLEVAA